MNIENFGSVCSGGRYENLAEYYTDKKLPGVGVSIGLTRLFYKLNELNLIKAEKKSISDVLIIPMVEDLSVPINLATKLKVTAKFDTTGILDYLGEHYRMGIGYQVRASVYLTQLSLEITYQAAEPTTTESAISDIRCGHRHVRKMRSRLRRGQSQEP